MFSSIDWFIAVLVVVTEVEKYVTAEPELSRRKCSRKAADLPRIVAVIVREDRIVRGSRVLEIRGFWKE